MSLLNLSENKSLVNINRLFSTKIKMSCKYLVNFVTGSWKYVYSVSSECLVGLKKRKYYAVLYMIQFIRQKICDIDEKLSVDISEFLKQYYDIEKEKYQ